VKRTFAILILLAATLAGPAAASAHNAGHFILPTGTCHEVGSFRDAPILGQSGEQLDLVPETPNPPYDEIGTSFVGFNGMTPILPGPCR
jgi:hypothetical protein